MLSSSSLNTCQADSGFTASLFNVVYTPANNSATVDLSATSSIQGNVIFDVSITAYGLSIIRQTVDPCNIGLAGLCPMYVLLPCVALRPWSVGSGGSWWFADNCS